MRTQAVYDWTTGSWEQGALLEFDFTTRMFERDLGPVTRRQLRVTFGTPLIEEIWISK